MTLYLFRLYSAATFDISMYEGIEADRTVTRQAVVTVMLASLAAGIGASGWFGFRPWALLAVVGIALGTWAAWSVLMFQIGARLLPERDTHSDLGELLRTTGFAAAPGMLQILGVIPQATAPVFVATTLWMLATMVVAVKHALDYHSVPRAITVCLLAASGCVLLALGISVMTARPVW